MRHIIDSKEAITHAPHEYMMTSAVHLSDPQPIETNM